MGATLLTFLRYLPISTESYSAHEKVKNNVGHPNSLIIAKTSPFWRYQNCLVPLTDCNTVQRLASMLASEPFIPSTNLMSPASRIQNIVDSTR